MATEGRVTQDAIETLSQPVTPTVRVTQNGVEMLSTLPSGNTARLTQAVLELLSTTTTTVAAERVDFFIWLPV